MFQLSPKYNPLISYIQLKSHCSKENSPSMSQIFHVPSFDTVAILIKTTKEVKMQDDFHIFFNHKLIHQCKL